MERKKVLMLSSRIPYPLTAGFRIRIYNEAKYFRKAGWEVDLLCIGKEKDSRAYRNELKKEFSHVYVVPIFLPEMGLNLLMNILNRDEPFQNALYRSGKVTKILRSIGESYDLIIGNHIRMAGYLADLRHYLSEKQRKVPDIILDYHDAISYNYRNAISVSEGFRKWIYQIEYGRVLRNEIKNSFLFQKIVIVSSKDKEWLRSQGADTSHIHVIPVAVRDDIATEQDDKPDRNNATGSEESICFLGKMSYQPNEDAVLWFASKVWPLIRKKRPDMRFYVMGIEPSDRICELSTKDNHIIVTGFLDNPYDQIKKCIANVVPIRNGAGVQNKVLESMLLGVPTIVSPIAAEGIDAVDGKDYLIARAPEDYVEYLENLLKSSEFRKRVGTAGQQLIRDNYLWSGLWKKWEELINE